MGSITTTNLRYESDGSFGRVDAHGAFGSSYNNTGVEATTGETLTAASVGLSQLISVETPSEDSGYSFNVLGLEDGPAASCRIQVFQGGSGTTGSTTATNSSSSVTGTGTYTDGATSGALNLATPAFSGTGLTAAGQVITTTDNQTMTLDQCAGMWLISATGATPPNLILSNTAVTGAPAVLTVQGSANTDAGAYKIVKNLTVGSVTALSGTAAAQIQSGHTHSVGAAAGGEVPNGTDLSVSLAKVQLTISGK